MPILREPLFKGGGGTNLRIYSAFSHDNYEKIKSWIFFSFLYEYGVLFGGPLGLINLLGLRWLKTVSSTFQDVAFDGSLLPLTISCCYNHGIKKLPNHW